MDSRQEELLWKAISCNEGGLPEQAVTILNNLIREDPLEAAFFFVRGMSFYYMEELNLAIMSFTKAARLDPEHIDAHAWRGWCRLRQPSRRAKVSGYRDLCRAARLCKKSLEHPSASWIFADVGRFYLKKGKIILAKSFFDFSILSRPDPEAYCLRAQCYMKTGHFLAAYADLASACRLDPENPKYFERMNCVRRRALNQS